MPSIRHADAPRRRPTAQRRFVDARARSEQHARASARSANRTATPDAAAEARRSAVAWRAVTLRVHREVLPDSGGDDPVHLAVAAPDPRRRKAAERSWRAHAVRRRTCDRPSEPRAQVRAIPLRQGAATAGTHRSQFRAGYLDRIPVFLQEGEAVAWFEEIEDSEEPAEWFAKLWKPARTKVLNYLRALPVEEAAIILAALDVGRSAKGP